MNNFEKNTSQSSIKENELIFDTPKDYFNTINNFVIGQTELKKSLSVCVYKHVLLQDKSDYKPNHMLVAGPSGTGKTFSISTLLENIHIPHIVFDSSTVTITGYAGSSFDSAVSFLYNSTGNNISKTEKGVIIFDEIDKLFSSRGFKEDVTRFGAQNELLRLLEGNTVQVQTAFNEEPVFINTSKILFIFLGSFNSFKHILYNEGTNLYESVNEKKDRNNINILEFPERLLQCGLNTELVGRISYFAQTFPLNNEEIKKAIKSANNHIVNSYKKYFEAFSINIELDDTFIDYLTNEAEFEKFGMRKISHLLNYHLSNLMYEVEDIRNKYTKLVIKHNVENSVYSELS